MNGRCDSLDHILLACNDTHLVGIGRIGGVDVGHGSDEGVKVVLLWILVPRCVVRTAVGNQPSVVAATVLKRVIVGELRFLDDGLAVDDLARGNAAALRVTRGFLDAEEVRVADRLRAPC